MSTMRVIIVEDEVIVAEDLRATLSGMGYEVLGVFFEGASVLEAVRKHQPDIVLMDIMLKDGADGIDTAEQIISEEHIPVVFLTAYSEQGVLDRAKKAGGVAFLLKPFVPRELDATLQFALGRSRMMKQITESEERYRGLFNKVPVGLYSATRDGIIRHANPALAEVLGAESPEYLVGRNIREYYADPARREAFLHELDTTGVVLNFELRAIRQDGRPRWLQASARAIRSDDETVEGYEAFLNDITDRHLLEEKRIALEARTLQEQKDRSILTLAGGVAHQFNNALTVVLGNLELLKMKLVDPSHHAILDQVVHTGQEMATLTRHLLAYAQGGRYLPRTIGLRPVFSRSLELALMGRATDRVSIDVDIPDDLWPVMADQDQMVQVFANLFVNAVEGMESSGGTLTVRAENQGMTEPWECALGQVHASGEYIRIEIADTGPGIPADYQAKIFEPFFTTKFTGRGLGLAAVLGIVRNHGGCVSLDRSDVSGSVFVVYLPRSENTDKGEPDAVSTGEPGKVCPLALIVDDDTVVLDVTRQMLASRGYEVLCARSGQEALTLFREHRDSLSAVLLDVIMPDIHGHMLYQEMKKERPGLSIVVTSGYDASTAISRITLEPGDSFLQKPFSVLRLIKALQGTEDAVSPPPAENRFRPQQSGG